MSKELRLLAHAYHDIIQGAIPDETWLRRVKAFQAAQPVTQADAATGESSDVSQPTRGAA